MRWPISFRSSLVALVPVCCLLSAGRVAGADGLIRGSADVGQRGLDGERASSKFQEYRQIPSGLFVNHLKMGLENPGGYLRLNAILPGQEDQRVLLSLGKYGRVRMDLQWDQTPHLISTTGRTVFAQSPAGVFAMPLQTRQDLSQLVTTDTNPGLAGVQPDLTALGNLVNGSARGVDLRTDRKTGKASLRYTPEPGWDLRVQYSVEDRTGYKPLGANFAFNAIELPEPIDTRTQEVRASSEFANKRWDARMDYSASLFTNGIKSLTWDNPFIITAAAGRPSQGRLGEFPENTAQNLALSGAVNLPNATRLAGTVSYGWRRQNAPFLPFTINPVVAALPTAPQLPAQSLNGAVNTLLTNVSMASRPTKDVSLTGRYRYYRYDNNTPSLVFKRYISYDTQVGANARRNLPIAHTRQNAGLDLGWRLAKGASVKLGYGWEGWDRTHRDGPKTKENALRTALNLTPSARFNLRASYDRAARRVHDYDAEVHVAEETFPEGETGLGQLAQLRKFDMASRDRDRVEVMAQLNPSDGVTLSGSMGYANDDFIESPYGLQKDRNTNVSFDVSYSPTSRFSLYGGFTRENYKYDQKSRQRTATNDKADNDWHSDLADVMNTFEVGLDGELKPGQVDLAVNYGYSDAKGEIRSQTVGAKPDIVTSLRDYPDSNSKLHRVSTALTFHISTRVTPRLEYAYERYSEDYFYKENLNPFMGTVDASTTSGIFLGATQPGYAVHMVSFAIGYSF